MTEQILVTIASDGSTTVEARGVVGKSCHDLTRELERALGVTTGDTLKPEYHQQTKASVNNVQR